LHADSRERNDINHHQSTNNQNQNQTFMMSRNNKTRPTSNAFSFHCMICFEEFDNTSSRYPVVLPCGHTYVCNTCSDRLEKCMECRTSLYMTFSPSELYNNNHSNNTNSNSNNNSSNNSILSSNHNINNASSSSSSSYVPTSLSRTSTWTSARAGGSTRNGPPNQYQQYHLNQQQQQLPTNNYYKKPPPPPPVIKKRLPLPKNVVLLALIEASELASADAEKELAAAAAAAAALDGGDGSGSGDNGTHTGQVDPNASSSTTTGTGTGMTSFSYWTTEQEEEEKKISLATSLSIGVAGTYAVAAREGLEIFPSRPSSQHHHPSQNNDDRSSSRTHVNTAGGDEDVDTLVQFFHMDNTMNNNNDMGNLGVLDSESVVAGDATTASADLAAGTTTSTGTTIAAAAAAGGDDGTTPTTRSFENKAHLSYADRVQIVSVEDGWAKLARGYGYVRAGDVKDSNSNNIIRSLVKVGSPVDRACKLEAMLRTLSYTRKALRVQQSQVDNEFVRLMNDLQVALQNDEDLTVICGTAFCLDNSNNSSTTTNVSIAMDNSEHDSSSTPTSPTLQQHQQQQQQRLEMVEEKKESSLSPRHRHQHCYSSPAAVATARSNDDVHSPQKATTDASSSSRPVIVADIESIRTGLMCFSPSVLGVTTSASGDSPRCGGAGGGGGGGAASSSANNHLQLSSSTPFSLYEMASSGRQLLRSSGGNITATGGTAAAAAALFPAASHPSPSEMRAGAQAWRERQSANAGAAVTNTDIDFRTGLSGHMALLSSHAHTHELLSPNTSSIRGAAAAAARGAHHGGSSHQGGGGGRNASTLLKMSSHTGLTSSKPFNLKSLFQAWNSSPSRSPGTTTTTTTTTAGGAVGHHQTLKHAGSM
jgi:Zinc finger, C3HC4 type (RING finger)